MTTKNIYLLGILAMMISACSRDLPTRDHRSALPTAFEEQSIQWNDSQADTAELEQVYLKSNDMKSDIKSAEVEMLAIDQELRKHSEYVPQDLIEKKSKLAKSFYQKYLQPLEKVSLNPNYSGNSSYSTNKHFRKILKDYSDGLALMLRTNKEIVDGEKVLDSYWRMASVGCTTNMSNCGRVLPLLKSISQSSFILEQIAWQFNKKLLNLNHSKEHGKITEADYLKARANYILNKFLAMRLSLASRNFAPSADDRIVLLYLMSNREFDELPIEARNIARAEQQKSFIDKITENLPHKMNSEKFRNDILPYIREADLWNRFSLNDVKKQNEQFGSISSAAEIMKLNCKYFRSNTDFEQSIQRSLHGKDASGNLGFLAELKKIREGSNSLILANLRSDYSFESNDILFIIDQLYRGHWNLDIAQECWNSITKDYSIENRKKYENKFITIFRNYIRIELIKKIIQTNEFMSAVFHPRSKDELKPTSSQIFFRAIEDSKLLKESWESMILRAQYVNGFIKSYQDEINQDLQSPEYKKLQSMVDSIRSNIKLVAAYPNMLVLCYYLAVKEFSISIPSWAGTYDLNAEMIISWILGDSIKDTKVARPLFDFGNDSNPIQTFENLYSFFYALKVNTFGNFTQADANSSQESSQGDKLVSDVNFFSEVAKRYLNTEINDLRGKIETLELRYANSEQYKKMKHICSVEKSKNNHNENAAEMNSVEPYEIKMSFKDPIEYTLVSYEINEIGAEAADIYGIDVEFPLKNIHNDLYRKSLFLATMIDLLEEHWASILEMKETNPEISKNWQISVDNYIDAKNKIVEIRKNLHDSFQFMRRFEKLALGIHRDQGDCLYTLHNSELDQQRSLYEREINYLSLVYDATLEMRSKIISAPTFRNKVEHDYTNAVNGKIDPSWLSEEPTLYKLALAAKTYMKSVGDVKGYDSITFNGGYTYSRWNMMLRLRHHLHEVNPMVNVTALDLSSIARDPLYRDGHEKTNLVEVQIDKNTDKSTFISKILTGAESKGFTKWWDKSHILTRFTNRVDTLLKLYINETSGVFQAAQNHCMQTEITGEEDDSCAWNSEGLPTISEKEIIHEMFRIAQLVHITDKEESIMRLLKKKRKYLHLGSFLKTNEEQIPLLNFPLQELVASKGMLSQAEAAMVTFNAMLSTGNNNNSANEITDAANRSSNELIFLSEHDSVRKMTRRNYRPIVIGTLSRIKNYIRVVECIEESHSNGKNQDDYKYLYELNLDSNQPRDGKWLDPWKDGFKKAVYLENRSKDDFVTLERDFNKQTKNSYRAMKGDPDFGAKKIELSCDELIKGLN